MYRQMPRLLLLKDQIVNSGIDYISPSVHFKSNQVISSMPYEHRVMVEHTNSQRAGRSCPHVTMLSPILHCLARDKSSSSATPPDFNSCTNTGHNHTHTHTSSHTNKKISNLQFLWVGSVDLKQLLMGMTRTLHSKPVMLPVCRHTTYITTWVRLRVPALALSKRVF